MRNFPLFFGLIEREMICLIERVASIVLGLFEHWRLIVLILFIMMKHVLLLLWNQESIL